jgi:hypothetical protein
LSRGAGGLGLGFNGGGGGGGRFDATVVEIGDELIGEAEYGGGGTNCWFKEGGGGGAFLYAAAFVADLEGGGAGFKLDDTDLAVLVVFERLRLPPLFWDRAACTILAAQSQV